jgi:uncharacterized membrane protein YccC
MISNYIDLERVSHGIKTAFACLIGFGITRLFYFQIHQWLIITIIIVMCAQLSVGSMIQKSYMRFLGTLIGSMIAAFTIFFFPNNETAYAAAVTLSVMFFSYIATGEKFYAEAGTLGAATVVIILIGMNPTLKMAGERFLEISLGILIAALVSQFILPVHARKHLRDLQAKTIRQLREFYLVNQIAGNGVENFEDYQKLEEGIAQLLIKQRKLSTDAARELIGEEFKTIRFQQLLRAERGILRAITIMHYIQQRFKNMDEIFVDKTILKNFEKNISTFLEKIAICVETDNKEKIQLSLPDIDAFKKYVFEIESGLSDENLEYVNAYLFSVEMLVDYLKMLLELYVDVQLSK